MSKLNKAELMNYKLFESTLNQAMANHNDEPFFEMAGRLPKDKSGMCNLAAIIIFLIGEGNCITCMLAMQI
ncbi:MAG: hypothetical protein K2O06_15555 [Acetatifactor sp.]|nr:hypothetical protein [Acetatifactor sp.]